MSRQRSSAGTGFGHVFGIPTLLALLSVIGLLSALLGDGAWDVVSWIGLGTLIAVILWRAGRPVTAPAGTNRKAGGRN